MGGRGAWIGLTIGSIEIEGQGGRTELVAVRHSLGINKPLWQMHVIEPDGAEYGLRKWAPTLVQLIEVARRAWGTGCDL